MRPFALLLLLAPALGQLPLPRAQPQLLEQGRRELGRVQELSLQPGTGECWRRALSLAEGSCQELGQEQQDHIALGFTRCHLESSGKSFPACPESAGVQSCVGSLDSVSFLVYTEFFTHAHSICYYLQSELWHQQMEETITRLRVTSESVSRQLEAADRLAADIMAAQNVTLRAQDQVLRHGEVLKATLQDSTQGVQRVFREMQDATREQQHQFAEVFRRLAYLQQFLLLETGTVHALAYYLAAFLLAFLTTCTQRTSSARLTLFLLLSLSVYVERGVYSSDQGPHETSLQHTERVYALVWLWRKLVAIVGALMLVYSAVTYQDVARQNRELLRCLKVSQCHLQSTIEEAGRILRDQGPGGRLKVAELDSGFGDVRTGDPESLLSGSDQLPDKYSVFTTSTPEKAVPLPRSARKPRTPKRSGISVRNILHSDSPSKYNLRRRTAAESGAAGLH
ncbi:uncharacterized protein LOC132813700 isoform X2 [Hemiscyllium ocellatum]|uniref:uncharacterized protein LOC132813700 isoform X2 n=1 Tax=Hemiscyllium ocellatum TaxID=170820 RepID=UPI0029661A3A|nr:uncharacterized protein LOC132813700 isoform X2 [Hemiscyllium ocellatum]